MLKIYTKSFKIKIIFKNKIFPEMMLNQSFKLISSVEKSFKFKFELKIDVHF